nr:MAG TPA: hypothetical protein [Caudoviricetes sp.]DAV06580.1 MAG TPA: hypothetical protein [Caudoviricetes sp.]
MAELIFHSSSPLFTITLRQRYLRRWFPMCGLIEWQYQLAADVSRFLCLL